MVTRKNTTKLLLSAVVFAMFASVLPVLAHASDLGAANWTRLSPATSPSDRIGHAMAYDPISKKIVLFGGFGTTHLNDTWTFDGSTWTKEKPKVAPPVRTGATLGYDRHTHKLVMFGGFNGRHSNTAFLHDTWLWDGATSTWTEAKMKTSPPRATGAVVFADPLTRSLMMFGGWNATQKVPNLNKTWRWNGKTWQQLHPGTSPYGRGWAIAVTDPVRKNVVLTGGNGDTIRTDNTWTWDGHDWTQQFPTTQVQALVFAGSTFDPISQSAIVFGGFGEASNQDVNQTWSWDGTNWVLLNPKRSPSARDGLAMTYDPSHRQIVMFGGESLNGKELHDTWKWTGQ